MKNLSLIAAIGDNKELGFHNQLIWHFKEDMRFFKNTTMGHPIIMGYKTMESLPKLLPGRTHIVLTRKNIEIPGVIVVHSIEDVLELVKQSNLEHYVIGGASIYEQFIDYCDKMMLTEIHDTHDADVYFPNFDKNDWNEA